MHPLIKFIQSRPSLKDSVLERNSGIPKRMLYQIKKGLKPFPDTYTWPLCVELCKYGLTIDGWSYSYGNGVIRAKKIREFYVENGLLVDKSHYVLLADNSELVDFLNL